MLVSVGRAPLVDGIGLEAAGVTFDQRKRRRDRRPPPHVRPAHLRGRRRRRLLAARAHRVPRGRDRRRERDRPRGGDAATPRCRGRSTPIPRSPASASPRRRRVEQHGAENIAVGRFPWVANARAVMSGETAGWVKSIHETTYGELARRRHRRAARDRPDRGRGRRARRRGDDRDGRRRDGAASDALRGDQGSRARRARPRDPPSAAPQVARVSAAAGPECRYPPR